MLNLKAKVIPADGPREMKADLAIMEDGTAGARYNRLFVLQRCPRLAPGGRLWRNTSHRIFGRGVKSCLASGGYARRLTRRRQVMPDPGRCYAWRLFRWHHVKVV